MLPRQAGNRTAARTRPATARHSMTSSGVIEFLSAVNTVVGDAFQAAVLEAFDSGRTFRRRNGGKYEPTWPTRTRRFAAPRRRPVPRCPPLHLRKLNYNLF
ncbi:hypothetical protein ISCGN_025043 [Ixodes scapularis]